LFITNKIGLGLGMTLEAVKEAIEQLPAEEQTALAAWLSERDWEAWDQQIIRDCAPGGRAAGLLAELEAEIAAGKTEPMEDGFARRRK
jgi:hypothetical protein